MAQHNLRQLVHKHGGHIDPFAGEQGQVAGFQCGVCQQPITEAQPHSVVVGGVAVGQCGQLFGRYGGTGVVQQMVVQGQLGLA